MKPPLPKRADALRSRESLIRSARAHLETGNIDVPIDSIVKDAGVGIGTFYRHFKNRKMLIRAIYQHEIDAICAEGIGMLRQFPPGEALWRFLNFALEHAAKNSGLAQALAHALADDIQTFDSGENKLLETLKSIMAAGVQEGSVRPEVQPETLVAALSRLCSVRPNNEWLAQAKAILGLIYDGLCVPNEIPAEIRFARLEKK